MSKQSEAKQAQGYEERPVIPVCMNCKHYDTAPSTIYDDLLGDYVDLIGASCGIGGFAVKKIATCKLYERKD